MKADAQVQPNVKASRKLPVGAARIGDRAKAVELGLKVDTYVLMALAFADEQTEVGSASHTAAAGKTG